jgi:cobaltochelatase CobS
VSGALVLIERNGDLHICNKVPEFKPSPFDVKETPVPTPKPAPPAPTTGADDALSALRALIGGPTIDRAEIETMVLEVVDATLFPTRTIVQRPDGEKREIEGDTHHQLADVATALLAGEHVMMVGPAGTGKSTIAEQAAEALGLESYSLSLSPQTPASQIVGYMQATGDYVPTLFRRAYENGGLFHFDEVDNAHPSVLAVINAALANGHMAFPDGMVKRNDNFRAVASANTYGRGATRAYVGRQAMDAATLDRFTVLTIDIDEALESALCKIQNPDLAEVDKVLKYVRKLRKAAETNGLNVVLSPRASIGMCRLLAAGMSWAQAVDARVRRGLDDATWNKLNG